MMTLEGFMAVISLVLTCFGLGYAIGSNTKNNRQSLRRLRLFFN